MARNFRALAELASSGPSEGIFLNGWPHEALGDELSRCLNSGVAEGMKVVEYLMAERRWDEWMWFPHRCFTVQLDLGTGNEEFLQLEGYVSQQKCP